METFVETGKRFGNNKMNHDLDSMNVFYNVTNPALFKDC